MSVQSEIDRINGNVASTYTALSEMGAIMPETQNSDNLPETVRTVPTGGGSGGKTVQSDWNQTDETAADFIKNKPFGDSVVVVVEEQEVSFNAEMGACVAIHNAPIQDGDGLTVVCDGSSYTCTAFFLGAGGGGTYFGNLGLLGEENTGEPFCGAYAEGMVLLLFEDEANHTVKIVKEHTKKIPSKYYDVRMLFRWLLGDNDYLYIDDETAERGIRKATLEELKAAAKNRIIYISQWTSVSEEFAYISYPVTRISWNTTNAPYGVVIFSDADGQKITLKTAEYTPET